jgi:hypothetical protein
MNKILSLDGTISLLKGAILGVVCIGLLGSLIGLAHSVPLDLLGAGFGALLVAYLKSVNLL